MTDHSEKQESIWIITIAPTIWALHFLLSYATAALYCGMIAGRNGSMLTVQIAIAAYTGAALLGISVAFWLGYRRHRVRTESIPHDSDTPEDRHQFLGFATMLLSGLSAVATIYAGMVILFFDTCH